MTYQQATTRARRAITTATASAIAMTMATAAFAQSTAAPPAAAAPVAATPPTAVKFYGNPSSPISGGVALPPGTAFLWTSGTGPPVADAQAKPDSPTRFGDTKTQAVGILQTIQKQLAAQGLGMKDVVYLRCYLVADPNKGNQLDVQGWNEGYKQFFGTTENPTKPARSTVGVAALVVPGWLVEIEVFAAYPAAK